MERKVPKRRIEKIVISGKVVEYYRYLKPLSVEPREHDIEKNKEKSEGKRDRNLYRARADLRRAIWCNQTKYTKFVTLTYKNTELDQDNVIYDFKQFIKKLRRRGYNVPYVYVTEHQKKRGVKEGNAGSLHIHALLFTDDFISAEEINNCWGLGNTDIHSLNDVNNLGAYVCKYLTKEEFNEYHKHSYHLSRGLKKPEVLTTDGYIGAWGEMYANIHAVTTVKYSNTTEFEYVGADGSVNGNTILYEQGILD
jgi:hypothetical protein